MFIHDKLYADPTWNKTFLAGANLNDLRLQNKNCPDQQLSSINELN
jgi:hypothetical protein